MNAPRRRHQCRPANGVGGGVGIGVGAGVGFAAYHPHPRFVIMSQSPSVEQQELQDKPGLQVIMALREQKEPQVQAVTMALQEYRAQQELQVLLEFRV